MKYRNSLAIGYDHGHFIEIVSGDIKGFAISGQDRHLAAAPPAFGMAFAYPEMNPVTGEVVIRQSLSGIIRSWDFNKYPGALLVDQTVALVSARANLAIDAQGHVYFADLFGGISKSVPGQPAVQLIGPKSVPEILSALRINPKGELCLLYELNGIVVSNRSGIDRFDRHSGKYLGAIVSETKLDADRNLATATDFDIDPMGNFFVASTVGLLVPVIHKFDPSGHFLGQFGPNTAYTHDIKCVRVSPDGKFVFVLAGDLIQMFDANGQLINKFSTSSAGATSLCFIKEAIPDPKFNISVIAAITSIWAGVYPDNSGFGVPPGGVPGPIGPWAGREVEVWNSLSNVEREQMTALAIDRLAGMLTRTTDAQVVRAALQTFAGGELDHVTNIAKENM